MRKKKNMLKNLSVNSVDFCSQGANQEAYIMLKKSAEEGSGTVEETNIKEAMKKSIIELLNHPDTDTEQVEKLIAENVDAFYEDVEKAIAASMETTETITECEGEKEREVEKMSENETAEDKKASAELHPEVKKALEENEVMKQELEELKKSLEISKLETVAKKYEVLGKKADDLAPKLYDMKAAGGTAYADYVTLLDEQVEMVEKSGIFKEIGSNRSGGNAVEKQLADKITELQKADSTLTYEQAFVRVCDTNPDIRKSFE